MVFSRAAVRGGLMYSAVTLLVLGALYTSHPPPASVEDYTAHRRTPTPAACLESEKGAAPLAVPPEQLDGVRRQVELGLFTTRRFLHHHLKRLANTTKEDPETAALMDALLAEAEERLRVIQYDLTPLESLGGLTAWREREALQLQKLVQRRLRTLQNPPSCTAAKKLACQLDRRTGAGSTTHHLVHCFMAAYATGRTLVLHPKKWIYSKEGWEALFQPLSDTCNSLPNSTKLLHKWPGTADSPTVVFPLWDNIDSTFEHRPRAVPLDIARRLRRFHGVPAAWWTSQFVAYLTRLQPVTQEMVSQVSEKLHISHPFVGVHVRRTDKLKKEAKYFALEEYMEKVEDYYLGLDLSASSPVPRKVYLASDEPTIINEARKKYPKYSFIWHKKVVAKGHLRYSLLALKDFFIDLYFLSRSDHLVCTFSSNVCRLAYEMMQTHHSDASLMATSLDTPYYFYTERPHFQRVRFQHNPNKTGVLKEEVVSVEAGQRVREAIDALSDGQRGYISVKHPGARKDERALLPDFKLQDLVDVVNVSFPDQLLSRLSNATNNATANLKERKRS